MNWSLAYCLSIANSPHLPHHWTQFPQHHHNSSCQHSIASLDLVLISYTSQNQDYFIISIILQMCFYEHDVDNLRNLFSESSLSVAGFLTFKLFLAIWWRNICGCPAIIASRRCGCCTNLMFCTGIATKPGFRRCRTLLRVYFYYLVSIIIYSQFPNFKYSNLYIGKYSYKYQFLSLTHFYSSLYFFTPLLLCYITFSTI